MKKKIETYIATWEERCYFNGIPDKAPDEIEHKNNVPSYRKIAIAILKNDYPLKTLGFTAEVSKFYHAYKRIELQKRNPPKQLKLDL